MDPIALSSSSQTGTAASKLAAYGQDSQVATGSQFVKPAAAPVDAATPTDIGTLFSPRGAKVIKSTTETTQTGVTAGAGHNIGKGASSPHVPAAAAEMAGARLASVLIGRHDATAHRPTLRAEFDTLFPSAAPLTTSTMTTTFYTPAAPASEAIIPAPQPMAEMVAEARAHEAEAMAREDQSRVVEGITHTTDFATAAQPHVPSLDEVLARTGGADSRPSSLMAVQHDIPHLPVAEASGGFGGSGGSGGSHPIAKRAAAAVDAAAERLEDALRPDTETTTTTTTTTTTESESAAAPSGITLEKVSGRRTPASLRLVTRRTPVA